ncbi:hypothetical protein [Herbidospora cretacea]|uniref:hypothetical protein n=1 Tax=Herbidospora cretacea TaxID=28444 RepID=UPI000AE0B503|nr:hypothetical protein [Herbidospora cretacea]
MPGTMGRLVGAAVVALGVLGLAAPAQADDTFRTLYLFRDAGYEPAPEGLYRIGYNEYNVWAYIHDPRGDLAGLSDKASSLINRDWNAWVVYDDKWFRDRRFCIRPGESVPNLSAAQWKFNDKISSAQRLDSASCAGYPAFFTTA